MFAFSSYPLPPLSVSTAHNCKEDSSGCSLVPHNPKSMQLQISSSSLGLSPCCWLFFESQEFDCIVAAAEGEKDLWTFHSSASSSSHSLSPSSEANRCSKHWRKLQQHKTVLRISFASHQQQENLCCSQAHWALSLQMKGYLHDGCALSIKLANKGNLHVHWASRLQTMVPSCALSIKLANNGTFMCIEHQACKQRYHFYGLPLLWLTDSHKVMITLNLVGFFVLVLLDLDKTVLCSSVLVLLLSFLCNLRRDITLGPHCEDTSCTVREHDW
jgi:hypothetical protein